MARPDFQENSRPGDQGSAFGGGPDGAPPPIDSVVPSRPTREQTPAIHFGGTRETGQRSDVSANVVASTDVARGDATRDAPRRAIPMPTEDHGVHKRVDPDDHDDGESGRDAQLPHPLPSEETDLFRSRRPKEFFPDEPHDDGPTEPQGDALERQDTYSAVSASARSIIALLRDHPAYGAVDAVEDTPGSVRQIASWSTSEREGDSRVSTTSHTLTIEDDLVHPGDTLRLTRRELSTTVVEGHTGRVTRQKDLLMGGDGTIGERIVVITEPPPLPRPEPGAEVPPPRPAQENPQVPGQRVSVSGEFPAVTKFERFEPLRVHEAKVAEGDLTNSDPEGLAVTTAARDELVRALAERADGTRFRVEYALGVADQGEVRADDSQVGAIHGTSLETVLNMLRTGTIPGNLTYEDPDYPEGLESGDLFALPTTAIEDTITQMPHDLADPILAEMHEPGTLTDPVERAKYYARLNAQTHAVNRALGFPLQDDRVLEWVLEGESYHAPLVEHGIPIDEATNLLHQAIEREGFIVGIHPRFTTTEGIACLPGGLGESDIRIRTGERGLPDDLISRLQPGGPIEAQFLEELRTTTDLPATLAKWEQPLQP